MEIKEKEKVKHQPKFWNFEILIQKITIAELGGCWNFKVKQEKHLANLDKVDGRDLLEMIMTKWKWIFMVVPTMLGTTMIVKTNGVP
jgi:hypothetical protein